MKQLLQTEAYNFDQVRRYSLYTALISFVLMFFTTMWMNNSYPLWHAIVVIGMPYSYFVSRIKKSPEQIIFEENQILLNGRGILFEDIESYHLFESLRLYFVLRITLKTGQRYMYYIPIVVKPEIETYFDKEDLPSSKGNFDFIARYYSLLYALSVTIFLMLIYSFAIQFYYFLR